MFQPSYWITIAAKIAITPTGRAQIANTPSRRTLIATNSLRNSKIAIIQQIVCKKQIAYIPTGNTKIANSNLRLNALTKAQLPKEGSTNRNANHGICLCQPFLPLCPRVPFASQVWGSERLVLVYTRTSHFATGRRDAAEYFWFVARKKRNCLLHALRGNHCCRLCNCSLVDRTYNYVPEVFRTIPVCLANGMAIHKAHHCAAHLSLWYYRRGIRHYSVYYGNLYRHYCAARVASGTPGDHGQPKHLFRNFFGLHNGANRQTMIVATIQTSSPTIGIETPIP